MSTLMGYVDFQTFADQHVLTLPPGYEALHVQAGSEYIGDVDARNAVKADPSIADSIGSGPYITDFLVPAVEDRKIRISRLRVLPSVGQYTPSTGPDGLDEEDILADIRMYTQYSGNGENVRFTWYGEQIGQLVAAHWDLSSTRNLCSGAEQGIARGSFWETEVIRMMNYDHHGNFWDEILKPPFTSDILHYAKFWKDVFSDRSRSFDMNEALSMPFSEYHKVPPRSLAA